MSDDAWRAEAARGKAAGALTRLDEVLDDALHALRGPEGLSAWGRDRVLEAVLLLLLERRGRP